LENSGSFLWLAVLRYRSQGQTDGSKGRRGGSSNVQAARGTRHPRRDKSIGGANNHVGAEKKEEDPSGMIVVNQPGWIASIGESRKRTEWGRKEGGRAESGLGRPP